MLGLRQEHDAAVSKAQSCQQEAQGLRAAAALSGIETGGGQRVLTRHPASLAQQVQAAIVSGRPTCLAGEYPHPASNP